MRLPPYHGLDLGTTLISHLPFEWEEVDYITN